MKMTKRYSVYERGTDRPIYINGTAEECAAALGITRRSFYTQVMRSNKGHPPQYYEIFIDDTDEEEDYEVGTNQPSAFQC